MATRGIDIRQTADRIIFRASLKDSSGNKVTTGTTELRVYRLEDDGTLDVLDWDAGAKDFVSSGAADDEVTMSHQQSNGADNTGIWTYVLSDATILANFDSGQIYIAQVTNSGAVPESQEREFQFGGVEGNQASDTNVGTGARTVTATVNDGTDPLENATVRLTEGANSYTETTNASGIASFTYLPDATYAVAISKSGYSFTATTLTVDGNKTPTYSMTAVAVTPSADPDVTTAYLTAYDENGAALSGRDFRFRIVQVADGSTAQSFDADWETVTSDGSGLVEMSLVKGAKYQIERVGDGRKSQTVTIPAAAGATYALPSMI